MPRLPICFPVGACVGSKQSMFLSHIHVSLSLPYSLKSINISLGEGIYSLKKHSGKEDSCREYPEILEINFTQMLGWPQNVSRLEQNSRSPTRAKRRKQQHSCFTGGERELKAFQPRQLASGVCFSPEATWKHTLNTFVFMYVFFQLNLLRWHCFIWSHRFLVYISMIYDLYVRERLALLIIALEP